MTYKQTKKQFILALNSNAYLNMCECSDMKNAIKAIEKQIPKRPVITIHKAIDGNTNKEITYHLTHCPYCWEDKTKGYFDSLLDKGVEYCRRCGQALDWSEADE